MNQQRVKQEFLRLAAECLAELRQPAPVNDRNHRFGINPSLLIRGGLQIRGNAVALYRNTLNIAVSEVKKLPEEGGWNEAAVDDLLAPSLAAILSVDIDVHDQRLKKAAEEFVKQLALPSPSWEIHLPIFGLGVDCSGCSFGLITLVAGEIELNEFVNGMIPPRSPDGAMLAQLKVRAPDRTSAVQRAMTILEEHLTILNALCSDRYPGHVRLTSGTAEHHYYQVYRATSEENSDESLSGLKKTLTRVAVTRADYERAMTNRGGDRVSAWLSRPTEFGERLISGYILAGTASTDLLPQRSFLLFAIALESVVLGKSTKTEIGFQLSIHIANLLGEDLQDKRSIRKEVNDLYGIRSANAHTGKKDIADEKVERMRQFCLGSLVSLTISPAFTTMTLSRELDDWFTDRLLDSPSI